jgi:hypothetical protein
MRCLVERFFKYQILFRFYSTFFNFVSSFLNQSNVILKYIYFFDIRNFSKNHTPKQNIKFLTNGRNISLRIILWYECMLLWLNLIYDMVIAALTAKTRLSLLSALTMYFLSCFVHICILFYFINCYTKLTFAM